MNALADQNREELKRLPWYEVQRAHRLLRKVRFPQDRPKGRYLHVVSDVETVTEKLCRQHWHPNWELSAYYRGEDLNLSLPDFERQTHVDHRLADRVKYMQTHVRGWEELGGLSLRAHFEPQPSEHPKAHLTKEFGDVPRGMGILREQLDAAGVSYKTIRYR